MTVRAFRRHHGYALFEIAVAAGITLLATSCASSRHQFSQPTAGWRTRVGQLLYAAPNKTLIGDVVVRYSTAGNFELVLSKGPGVTLLSLREDADFAEVKGPLARAGWSGRIDRAPKQLRGWLELRDKIIQAEDRSVISHAARRETFLFRF